MNIGVDIDGVIYQTERLFRQYAEKYNEEIGGKMINPHIADSRLKYNWSEEQGQYFVDNYLILVETIADLYPDVREVLGELKKLHKITIITARGEQKAELELTKKRLAEDKVPFDNILYCQKSKAKACKENNIDIMIEDNYLNVLELKENGIRCLYFKEDFSIDIDGVEEVTSWKEVKKFFKI